MNTPPEWGSSNTLWVCAAASSMGTFNRKERIYVNANSWKHIMIVHNSKGHKIQVAPQPSGP